MSRQRFLFVGNRFPVLEELLSNRLAATEILVLASSPLAEELHRRKVAFETFGSKEDLCGAISKAEFEILVSNGCPFVLPVTRLKKPHQTFVNIHPSHLPDLRGMHPVNGALLFDRPGGATCHLMDDGIDTGAIVAQVQIPNTRDLDLGLLYRLSFMAEREVFLAALGRKFEPDARLGKQAMGSEGTTYYTRQTRDLELKFEETAEQIVRRVRAFGIASQLARFSVGGELFKVGDAEIIANPYLTSMLSRFENLEIAILYDDRVIFRRGEVFIKLKNVQGKLSRLREGMRLG